MVSEQGISSKTARSASLGKTLRQELLGKAASALSGCDHIDDTCLRLTMQAHLIDMIASVEDVIAMYGLDDEGKSDR